MEFDKHNLKMKMEEQRAKTLPDTKNCYIKTQSLKQCDIGTETENK